MLVVLIQYSFTFRGSPDGDLNTDDESPGRRLLPDQGLIFRFFMTLAIKFSITMTLKAAVGTIINQQERLSTVLCDELGRVHRFGFES